MCAVKGGFVATIFLIDDDVIGLRVREALLRFVGYEVLTTTTGHAGVVLAHALRPDYGGAGLLLAGHGR